MIYFISGLGADERVFQFLDLPGIEKKFIQWMDPFINETIEAYSGRLCGQIDITKEVVLVGISFGGLIAQEMAGIINCRKVIIISSIISPEYLSIPMKLIRFTKTHKLVPAAFLKWSNRLTADYFFSTKSKEESTLLREIIKDTDEWFMVWAIDQIMCWHVKPILPALLHIHGTRDRIFPEWPSGKITLVEGGGHFMIVNRAKEISIILMKALEQ